jgi:hypothetical protein
MGLPWTRSTFNEAGIGRFEVKVASMEAQSAGTMAYGSGTDTGDRLAKRDAGIRMWTYGLLIMDEQLLLLELPLVWILKYE